MTSENVFFNETVASEPTLASRGKALSFRATRLDDVEALAAIMNMPGVRVSTLRLPYQSHEYTRKWLENKSADSTNIVAIVDGIIVGHASLDRNRGRRSHSASIGIVIHDDYQDRGIGTALMKEIISLADNWLNLMRLELTVYVDNARAIHLYEKLGFEREGILKLDAFRDGSFVDSLTMARLRR